MVLQRRSGSSPPAEQFLARRSLLQRRTTSRWVWIVSSHVVWVSVRVRGEAEVRGHCFEAGPATYNVGKQRLVWSALGVELNVRRVQRANIGLGKTTRAGQRR